MKKFKTTMKMADGKEKEIAVWLDENIAATLEASGDAELINQYIIEEYKSGLTERRETRRHLSLENSMDKGFDIADSDKNIEEDLIKKENAEKLHKVIESLEPQQKWLIEQIYFLERTQVEVAHELGIDTTSVRDRLKIIHKKLRKIFEF